MKFEFARNKQKKKSQWQTHLTDLVLFPTLKTYTQLTACILGNRASYAHALSPAEKLNVHFLWDPGPMNVRSISY